MIIDTHAHLYYPELLAEIDSIIQRSKERGIEKIIVPAVNLETSKTVMRLSEKYEMIYFAAGIHPCDVEESKLSDLAEIEKLLVHEKAVGIGETGLDYYWNKSNQEKQKIFFIRQIEIAKEYRLPVIIHTRDSVDDAIEIISQRIDENLKGQFHCFSGDVNHLSRVISFDNFYVSFCGNVTYKKYSGKETIEACPAEKILSETDSPFLPPEPFRGKRNEPGYVLHTLKKIAELKNIDYDEFLNSVYANSMNLFFTK